MPRPVGADGAQPVAAIEPSSAIEVAREYGEHYPEVDLAAIELCVRLIEDVKIYHQAVERFYAALGFEGSYARFGLLRAIYFSEEGRLPHHEISRHMRASTANISKLVTRVEREGLVRRVADEADRRISWVELTQEGRRIAEHVMPANADFFHDVLHGLTARDRDALIELLERFRISALTYDPNPD